MNQNQTQNQQIYDNFDSEEQFKEKNEIPKLGDLGENNTIFFF